MKKRLTENDIRLNLGEPLLLFVFALAVRLSLFPYWQNLDLSGDEVFYWSLARDVADGTLPRHLLRPPLWTYVLSISALISDHHVYGRFFTSIISSFSVPVIYFLGRSVFNRRVGIIAGVTYSIYPNLVGYSHYLWAETFFGLLIVLSTLFFFKGIDNEKKHIFLYLSFAVSSISLLVKEFAVINFGAIILTLATIELANKKRIIIRAIIILLTPITVYSAFASLSAGRPVILADAFVYNSNEASGMKKEDIWKKSPRENLRIFIDKLFMLREIPVRFARQVHNLWTPTSFPIFRLLHSQEGYNNVPRANLVAYITAGMYILVIVLGLIGMCCAEMRSFQVFAVANLLFLSLTGFLFLLCSRFRIPFIYLFIIYSSVVLSNPKAVLKRMTLPNVLILVLTLTLFINVIIVQRTSFGFWG